MSMKMIKVSSIALTPKIIVTLHTLLTLATLAWWARSYAVIDFMEWYYPRIVDGHWHIARCCLQTFHGGIQGYVHELDKTTPVNPRKGPQGTDPSEEWKKTSIRWLCQPAKGFAVNELYYLVPTRPHWLGFQITADSTHHPGLDSVFHGVVVPFWLVGLLSIVPALLAVRKPLCERWRRKHGCCVNCGYDLRATPDRCPECGTNSLN